MGNVTHARKFIHGKSSLFAFDGKNTRNWSGADSWLHIFFNKSLFIVGLGLEESETFLRWLLIERAKYFRKFHNKKHKGWFITKSNKSDKNREGRRLF